MKTRLALCLLAAAAFGTAAKIDSPSVTTIGTSA